MTTPFEDLRFSKNNKGGLLLKTPFVVLVMPTIDF
jgi:hypothetical protein